MLLLIHIFWVYVCVAIHHLEPNSPRQGVLAKYIIVTSYSYVTTGDRRGVHCLPAQSTNECGAVSQRRNI